MLVASLLLAAAPVHAVEFTVSPVQQTLEVRPGATTRSVLSVHNRSEDQAISVRVYLWDWWYTDQGHRFEPPGTLDRSASSWFSAWPRELQLAAGESAPVTLNGAIPKDVSGGYYAVAFVEARPILDDDVEGMQVVPGARIASLMMVRISGTGTTDIAVDDVRITPPEAGTGMGVALDVTNHGDVHTFVALKSILRDAEGQVVGRVDARPLRMLPGQRRLLEASWDGPLAPGSYQLVGTLVWDETRTLPLQQVFEVPGP